MRGPGGLQVLWAERLFDSAGSIASKQHCIAGSCMHPLATLEVVCISMERQQGHSREGTFEPFLSTTNLFGELEK
jgi:hypothetical protein